jgi:hypothetical protein
MSKIEKKKDVRSKIPRDRSYVISEISWAETRVRESSPLLMTERVRIIQTLRMARELIEDQT